MTGLPFSLQAMDLWIECTMNLGSKLKQGWLNLLDDEKQLLSTTRNVNNIARIRSTVKRNLKKKDRRRIHVDCQMSRVKKDERAVQDIEACLQEFDTEPFDESNPALRTLQSAITASAELVTDVKNAVKEGDGQGQTLLQERVYTKQSSIRDTISRNKRIDFASDYVPKASGENMKQNANQMEKNGLISIFNLAEKSNLIDFAELLQYRITAECLSVFNVDRSMRKTQKSKLLETSITNPLPNYPRQYISVIDMGFLWRLATPSSDDREIVRRSCMEYTWGDYAKKVVSLLVSLHPYATKIFCVNDVYNREYTIKDDERDRRAMKEHNIPNVAMKTDDKLPSNAQFKWILLNSSNIVRLQHLIGTKLREYSRDTGKEFIQCTGTMSKNILTDEIKAEFAINHVEAEQFSLHYIISCV